MRGFIVLLLALVCLQLSCLGVAEASKVVVQPVTSSAIHSSDHGDFLPAAAKVIGHSFVQIGRWTGHAIGAFDNVYRTHRNSVIQVAQESERLRENVLVGVFAFIAYLIVSVPTKLNDVTKLFNIMMRKNPLPPARSLGITDEAIKQTRTTLFFYCLFFLYQIVQFPLTRWNQSNVAFWADLLFQLTILIFVFSSYWRLKLLIVGKYKDDEHKRKRVSDWLSGQLEEMRISVSSMRRLAAGAFAVAFTPVFLANLPRLLDAMMPINQLIVAMLPA